MHFRTGRRHVRRSMLYALAFALAICVACDKNESPDNPGGGGGGTVSNGARLGWLQVASSLQQAQAMTYQLYVDGSLMPLTAVSCSQGSGGYDCSGRLPSMSAGRHVLELSSTLNGVESLRSAPLTITFNTSVDSTLPSEESRSDISDASQSSVVCLSRTARCHGNQVIASGLTDVTELSALPDGRLLFIEGGSEVRIVSNETVLAAPALSAQAGTTLVGLAVDSAFEQTRFVFVAWSEAAGNGEPRLNITRYREVAGTLGESAQIVTNLAFQPEARAPLAVDGTGLLYVALPSGSQRAAVTRDGGTTTGVILRFTREGTVPPDSWRGSPVLAYGYPRPTGLGIDTVNKRLWLAGIDSGNLARVAVYPNGLGPTARIEHPDPASHSIGSTTQFEPTLTLVSNPSNTQPSSLVVSADGQLLYGAITTQGKVDEFVPLATGQSLPLRSAVQSRDGSLYLVVGTTPSMSLVRLTEWRWTRRLEASSQSSRSDCA